MFRRAERGIQTADWEPVVCGNHKEKVPEAAGEAQGQEGREDGCEEEGSGGKGDQGGIGQLLEDMVGLEDSREGSLCPAPKQFKLQSVEGERVCGTSQCRLL